MADDDLMQVPDGEVFRVPIGTEIDLHHFSPRDIDSVVEEYLLEAWRLGYGEVRLIHGKGIGFQRQVVRQRLARTPFVIQFYDDPSPRGGKGATMAELRHSTGASENGQDEP